MRRLRSFPSREDGIPFLEENNAWGFVRIGQNPEYAGMYITGDVGAVMYVARVKEIVPASDATLSRPLESYRGVGLLLDGNSFGTVMIVFGVIGLIVGFSDLRVFRDPVQRGPWMMDHLSRMMGTYIATVTAVSVVNFTMVSPVVSWLWPTAIGIPLIWYWFRKYSNTGPFARLVPKA